MCHILQVSTAGYYAWRVRPRQRRPAATRAVEQLEIRVIHDTVKGRYGSPRVHAELTIRDVCAVSTP